MQLLLGVYSILPLADERLLLRVFLIQVFHLQVSLPQLTVLREYGQTLFPLFQLEHRIQLFIWPLLTQLTIFLDILKKLALILPTEVSPVQRSLPTLKQAYLHPTNSGPSSFLAVFEFQWISRLDLGTDFLTRLGIQEQIKASPCADAHMVFALGADI